MIFDFHSRLAPGTPARDRLLATMDALGITRAAVCAAGAIDLDRLARQIMVGGHSTASADNEMVAASCADTGGRLVPFFFGNPHAAAGQYGDVAEKYAGLELSPAVHGVAITDPRNIALAEIAARHNRPVYLVCIGRPGSGAPDLAALARDFPETTFILGHCGFIGIDLYSIDAIRDLKNVYAETSGCYTGIARMAIDRLGAGRVLFGTDYPLQHPDVELAKMRALRLEREELDQVMWRNAIRILGEEPS